MANDAASLFTEINTNLGATIGANQFGPSVKRLATGSLVQFTYGFVKPGPSHDKTPLVIVTDVNAKFIRGINLHYLNYKEIKRILQKSGMNACGNPMFSYQNNIKSNEYIKTAFRRYKRIGVRRLKLLNCDFVLNVMNSVRAIDPQELEAIRDTIKEQLEKTVTQSMPDMPQVET